MFQITQTINGKGAALIWILMGFDGHLVEKLGTTPKLISLKDHFLRYQPQIWNKTSSDFWF